MSKRVGEKCGKRADGRRPGRTDGRMDGRTESRTDGDPDGHHHTIIRPVWRRAYKNVTVIVVCYQWKSRVMPFCKNNNLVFWYFIWGRFTNSLYMLWHLQQFTMVFTEIIKYLFTLSSFDTLRVYSLLAWNCMNLIFVACLNSVIMFVFGNNLKWHLYIKKNFTPSYVILWHLYWFHNCPEIPNMVLSYENQEWHRVPDRKMSVEGDLLWHNPNRCINRGLDVKACRPRLTSSDLEQEVILDSFSRWILTIKCILLAFLLLFDA